MQAISTLLNTSSGEGVPVDIGMDQETVTQLADFDEHLTEDLATGLSQLGSQRRDQCVSGLWNVTDACDLLSDADVSKALESDFDESSLFEYTWFDECYFDATNGTTIYLTWSSRNLHELALAADRNEPIEDLGDAAAYFPDTEALSVVLDTTAVRLIGLDLDRLIELAEGALSRAK